MWWLLYYAVGLAALYVIVSTIYAQVTGRYSAWYARIPSLVGVVVSYFALRWAYTSLYPPTLFGGRRY